MIIACPKCSSGFFVAPTQIGATGRRVKCSKCKNVWHAMLPTAIQVEKVTFKQVKEPIPEGSNLPVVIPKKVAIIYWFAPATFLMMIFLTLWVLYPNFTKKIGLCGSMCNHEGLKIENVNLEYDQVSKKILVDYLVANNSFEKVEMPVVEVKLMNNKERTLKTVYATEDNYILESKTSAKIRTTFTSVPENTDAVRISIGSKARFWFR